MKKRIRKQITSLLLVLCMLAGIIAPAYQAQARRLDLLSMFDVAGSITRGAQSALKEAKKDQWNCGQAILGTFKCLGKEFMDLNKDESPGSTVIVNQVNLSGVEKELSTIQSTLQKQQLTLNQLYSTMNANSKDISTQLNALSQKIDDTELRNEYHRYLTNYFSFYNQYLEAITSYDKALTTLYKSNPTEANIKTTFDKLYRLEDEEYTGNFYSAINRLGKYLRGEYQQVDPGSVVDILCQFYEKAGYSKSETASAVKDFVANTYYAYCMANYYYLSVSLFQSSYIADKNLDDYTTYYGVNLNLGQIKQSVIDLLEANTKTTEHIFSDLNKHFSSLETMSTIYTGPAGTLSRTITDSHMDVEPDSNITLPDNNQLLALHLGAKYISMFGNVCSYSFECSEGGIRVDGNQLHFNDSLTDGKELKVKMYGTVMDEKTLLHTYTFTCKSGKLSGGYGTSEYPYVIKTTEDFNTFAKGDFTNDHISLAADLDFKDKSFEPVSGEFRGVFLGNGHSLSNVDLFLNSNATLGIFTTLSGPTCLVQNLTVKKATIQPASSSTGYKVGGIAGYAQYGARIECCQVIDSSIAGVVASGYAYVGGIAGLIDGAQIKGCITRNVTVAAGKDHAQGSVGGLVGYMRSGDRTRRSSVTYSGREDGRLWQMSDSKENNTGGLVGEAHQSYLKNCWVFKTKDSFSDSYSYPANNGVVIGLCDSLFSENCVVYNGENASQWADGFVAYGKLVQGAVPDIKYSKDMSLSTIGLDTEGYLTNADAVGNPVRITPLQIKLNFMGNDVTNTADDVKTSYYYGQNLSLNGLTAYLYYGGGFSAGLAPFDVTTSYNPTKSGSYEVTISRGNAKASYSVTVAKKPHTFKEVTKPATCTEDGYTGYKCQDEDCDEKITEQTLSATGHNMKPFTKTASNCTEDGQKEHWYCSLCKKYFLDETGTLETTEQNLVIPAAHTLTHTVSVPSNCTEDGQKEHWYCTVCKKYFLDEKATNETTERSLVIPASHTLTHFDTTPATCLETGKKEHWYCSVCKKYFLDEKAIEEISEQELILPLNEHDMQHFEKKESTCTETGISNDYWHCSTCNHYFLDENATQSTTLESLIIPASGHTPSSKNADCTVAVICKVCNETITAANPKHTWSAWVSNNKGSHSRHCTNCKKTETQKCTATTTKSLTKATASKDGKLIIKCSSCKHTISTTILKKASNISLSSTSYTYKKQIIRPSVIVKDSSGKDIDKANYNVSYSSGRKNPGIYTVQIIFKNNYSGTVKKEFTIKPKATKIVRILGGTGKLTVIWKKQDILTTGYIIQFGTSSSFKFPKTTTITANNKTQKTVSGLNTKKKYYVRICTYRSIKHNRQPIKIRSEWSPVKIHMTN